MTDLFSCFWFNEVNLFTPRDQISFGYVEHRLGDALKFFMFPNCEYNSLFILHRHTREHSSKVQWIKTIDEIMKRGLKESRGRLGLWTSYPTYLSSVELPAVKRTSPVGQARNFVVFYSFMVVQSRTLFFQKKLLYQTRSCNSYCRLMFGDFTITHVKEPRNLTHRIHAF